ncbi:Fungal-trans domain-containing protein [Mycena venus]|uniref:Fungal-trans domain-containing protein n=1 Tax=Mycena venus TaxID=2733690 RepID=A0A8H6U224_9AGAR|nr:Fungal-trans domain-containing protein [Mycena venus]
MTSDDGTQAFDATSSERSSSLLPGPPNPTQFTPMKQKRQQRSCDVCRRRKRRCDGPKTANGTCSNCLAFGSACTYVEPAQKRGPKNTYDITIEELKRENASLKAKLRSLSVCSLCAQPLQSQLQEGHSSRNTSVSPNMDWITSSNDKEPKDKDERDITTNELAARFSQFSLESAQPSYFGAGSSFALANNASVMKEKFLGPSLSAQRPHFWEIKPWEKDAFDLRPKYKYPAIDLIASLLDLYFTNIHPTTPILHRTTFERSVAEGVHLRDSEFGGLLLSVLALASRFSRDPRVFVESGDPLSAGWAFANQIVLQTFCEPTIHVVQMYCLLCLYILGTSAPQLAWMYIGIGTRCLQHRGEHRPKPEGHKWMPEHELWKRAFWMFVSFEHLGAVFRGRPTGFHAEDDIRYDVELPLEIDDVYWDQGAVQPLGKPSELSYFVCYVRVFEILGDAIRRLYGSKKAKAFMGWDGPEWEQQTVAELDSRMNSFLDSIPPHLRWDSENPPQGTFFDQSAILHITYNYVVIAVGTCPASWPTSFLLKLYSDPPALHPKVVRTIRTVTCNLRERCASAARAILHTADIWLCNLQRLPLNNITNPVFLSGVILVLYMLRTNRAGLPMEKNKDLARVATALQILKFAESRLQCAGRLWEMLQELCLDNPVPLLDPPSNEPHDNDASVSAWHIPKPSLSNLLDEYYPQLGQSSDSWNSMLTHDQSAEFVQGMSIEQLLASDGDPSSSIESIESILGDELMSMLAATPTNVRNNQH